MAMASENINNPFIANNKLTFYDDYSGEEVIINKENISKYIKHIYVMCPLANRVEDNIFDATINKDNLDNYLQTMVIYKVKVSLVKNNIHYQNIIILDKTQIQKSNHFNYELDEKVFIIPIFNVSFLNLKQYLDRFNCNTDLSKLYNMIVMSDYFSDNINNINNSLDIEGIIRNLNEANYWAKPYNCNINITEKWNKRKFIFSNIKALDNSSLKDFLESIDKVGVKENYLEEIFKSKKYIDPSSVVKRKGYRLFSPVKSCDFSYLDITNLFSRLNNYQRYLLFSKLVISKEYCHLVLNNSSVLKMMRPYIHKFAELYQYLFGYAWIRFYMEECIKRTYIKTTDYFIFDINTASELPVFLFDYQNPQYNPYMPIFIGNHSLNPMYNIGGIKIDENTKNQIHRICNLDEFKTRFNIFTTNTSCNNLFKNINFKNYKMAISGSIMTACLQYRHPLLSLFHGESSDDLYNRFYNEYYCESDVDIMIKTSDMFEFIDISNNLHKQITTNLKSFNSSLEDDHVKIDMLKKIFVFVTEDFIKKNIVNSNLPYEFIVSNLKNEKVINLFSQYIEKQHIIKLKEDMKDFTAEEVEVMKLKYPVYFEYNHGNNINIKLVNKKLKNTPIDISAPLTFTEEEIDQIIDNAEEQNENEPVVDKEFTDLNILFSFKAKIHSPYMDHALEVFPIKGDDFFATVSQFHLPCVRAYYDGDNVYMTPSCISAHLTFMNLDYKYFAGTNDPIEIINKYRSRGFGTWLNKDEIRMFLRYSSRVEFWNNLYQIDMDKPSTFKYNLGSLNMEHRLFHPRQYNPEHYWKNPNIKPIPMENPYVDVKQNKNYDNSAYLKNRYDAIEINNQLAKIGCNNMFIHINESTGYINPVNNNIIELVWELYQLPLHNKEHITESEDASNSKKENKIKWSSTTETWGNSMDEQNNINL